MKTEVLMLLALIMCSCRSANVIEVPVTNTQIEYRDRVTKDTLFLRDSVYIHERQDTVFVEKYKYLYKTREVRDTVNITDTITTVVTVEVAKEVNHLHSWQVLLMILGGVLIALTGIKLVTIIKGL